MIKKAYIINSLKIIILIVCIAIIAYYFKRYYSELQNLTFKLNYFSLLFGFIVLCLFNFFLNLIWYIISVFTGCKIKFKYSAIINGYANLIKYIPGKVLSYAFIYHYYSQHKVSKKNLAVAFYIDGINNIVIPGLVFIISLLFVNNKTINGFKIYAVILLACSIIMLHPKILIPIFNLLLKLLKKPVLSIEINYKKIIIIVLISTVNWFIYCMAFFLLVNSVYNIPLEDFFQLSIVVSASSILGFIVFFMPSGLGAREVSFIYLLSLFLPEAISLVIAVLSRLWMIIGDFFYFLIVLLFDYILKTNILKTAFQFKRQNSAIKK